MKPTFRNWSDRLTYIIAEAQFLVAGLIIFAGIALAVTQPTVPKIPEPVVDFVAATMIFGAPLFLAGTKFAGWLRRRNAVVVYEVNAVNGERLEKYLVPPEIWAEKDVEGPDPWPVNGGSAWAVRNFEWHREIGRLEVVGCWLSECSDDKLLTSRNHMEDIHSRLTDRSIQLNTLRDRISMMGVDIQEKTINQAAEARERGTMLEKTAIKRAVDDAKKDLPDSEDLPSIDETAEDIHSMGTQQNGHRENGQKPATNGQDAPEASPGGVE